MMRLCRPRSSDVVRDDPSTIAMSSDYGHRRLPRTLPHLEPTSRTDPPRRTTEDEDTRDDDYKKKRKKKHKKAHKNKKESDQLNDQSDPQVINDHTEMSKF